MNPVLTKLTEIQTEVEEQIIIWTAEAKTQRDLGSSLFSPYLGNMDRKALTEKAFRLITPTEVDLTPRANALRERLNRIQALGKYILSSEQMELCQQLTTQMQYRADELRTARNELKRHLAPATTLVDVAWTGYSPETLGQRVAEVAAKEVVVVDIFEDDPK